MRIRFFFIFILWISKGYGQNLEDIKTQKPVVLSGVLSANTGYYSTSNFSNTMPKFTWSLTAAPTISLYNSVQIPFNFVVNQGSSVVQNPFAQIGVNPYYKGWKGYFGWTNMSWSDYVLNGKTFLGAGSDIQLGLFRAGAMYGRFNPAQPIDTLIGTSSSQYTRSGYAARLGIGKEKNHVDLMLLRGHDHIQSIPANELNTSPQANLVIGIKNFQTFSNGKITWQLEASADALTRDLKGIQIELDSNNGLTNLLQDFIPIKVSTNYAFAIKNQLGYKGKYFGIQSEYTRIQPEYTSFGVDYIINDIQRIQIKENLKTKDMTSSFSFAQCYQHDNLNNRKAIKTNRYNFTNIWNYNPNQKFGLSSSYTLFIINQSEGNKYLSDSFRLVQLNHNLMMSPRWTVMKSKSIQTYSILALYQGVQDENIRSIYRINGRTFNLNLNYNYYENKRQWNFNGGLNLLHGSNNGIEFASFGPTIAVSKPWLDSKLNSNYSFTYLHNIQNGIFQGNTFSQAIQMSYAVDLHHSLRLNSSLMKGVQRFQVDQSELRLDLGYSYQF